jgi:hypothetical protein
MLISLSGVEFDDTLSCPIVSPDTSKNHNQEKIFH